MIKNGKYMGVTDENPFPDMYKLPYWAEEKVRQSYLECAKKGVTPPLDATLNNLPDTISEINTRPENPLQIDSDGAVIKKTTWSIAPATDVGYRGCYNLFRKTDITSADLSTLTAISGEYSCYYMLYECASLEESTLNNVETITGDYACSYMFDSTNIPSTNLGKLREIHAVYSCQYMFNLCPNITETGLDSLETISGQSACANMFAATPIKVARFPKLRTISGSNAVAGLLKNCTQLTDVYFDSLLSVSANGCFGSSSNQMLSGCENVTVHFPVGLQTLIGNWTSVVNGFGGTNTTVLFDLGVETTITIPAYTYFQIIETGDTLSDGNNSTPVILTRTLTPSTYSFFAVGTSAQTMVCDEFEVTAESHNIEFNFDNYEYGIIYPTNNQGFNLNYYGLLIKGYNSSEVFNWDKYIVNVGSSFQLTCGIPSEAEGYILYPPTPTITVESGIQEMTLYFYPIQEQTTFNASNNFGNITLDGYWSIENGLLKIHPDIETSYKDSRGIAYTVQNSDLHGIRVTVSSYASSESTYDWGFVSFGTEQVFPTAANIKSGVISNGKYIVRQSGAGSMSDSIGIVVTHDLISEGGKVITVGWGQDSSASGGDNAFYVQQIKIEEF